MYLEFRGATADGLCRESPRKMLLAPCGKGLVLDDRSPPLNWSWWTYWMASGGRQKTGETLHTERKALEWEASN